MIASFAGAPKHPAWYHNLKAHPMTTIELGTEKFQAKAVITTDPERQRLFDAQAKAIHDHGGEILKFIGDGLLAIFPLSEAVAAMA